MSVEKGSAAHSLMAQFQFQFPSTAELDAYAEKRHAERGWLPPDVVAPVQEPSWFDDAGEALLRTAYVDPISVMITFLRLED